MASADQRLTCIEVINEVRRLIGLNTVTHLTDDKHAAVALRLLNKVVATISNAGDWHELLGSANVTAVVSVREYSLGVVFPVKNIFEVSISGRAQALDPIDLSDYQRYARGGGVGTLGCSQSRGLMLRLTITSRFTHPGGRLGIKDLTEEFSCQGSSLGTQAFLI